MNQSFLDILEKAGAGQDASMNLVDCALAMAALNNENQSIERYQNHFKRLIENVAQRYKNLLNEGAEDNAATQLASLKHVIADQHEYTGDQENYDDLQNVDLIRVIERRKGMPVALALIYIHVAKAQGWFADALRFPAHVVCRIEMKGERLLFDPFHNCKILQAADLRQLLKTLINPHAELSTHYYEPSTNRELLIRMQNNIKLRQIESEDYMGALNTIETMKLLDPDEYRLLFDAGVLFARTNQVNAAIDTLEDYIDRAPNIEDQHEALLLLQQIKENQN